MKTVAAISAYQRIRIAAFAICLATLSTANELKDLLLAGGKYPSLKLVFTEGKQASDFPLFFQKRDIESQTVTVCFLETQTQLPLGKLPLSPQSPVPSLGLKKITTPSGKTFLGIEIGLSSLPSTDLILAPSGSQNLKITLPVLGSAKSQWSALKAIAAEEKAIAQAKPVAEPPPVIETPVTEPVSAQSEPQVATQPKPDLAPPTVAAPEAKVVLTEPSPPPSTPAPVTTQTGTPGEVSDLTIDVGTQQEDLIVVGDGLSFDFTFKRNDKDTLAYELRIPNAKLALKSKSYSPPTGSHFASLKTKSDANGVLIQIRLRQGIPAQAGMADGKLSVTLPIPGAVSFKWLASADKTVATSGLVESTPSAHSEGESLDQSANSLSSSKVFLPTGNVKPMILMRDSSQLRSKPQTKSPSLKSIPAGAQINKVDQSGNWIRVVSETDTGWIQKSDAAYADEITGKDEIRLQKQIAARERAIEVAQQKKADAIAKAESKAAAAQAKEAEIQAKAAAKAQAKADALAAKAQAKADAEAAKAQAKLDAEIAAQVKAEAKEKALEQAKAEAEAAKIQTQAQAQANLEAQQIAVSQKQNGTATLSIAANDEQKLSQLTDTTLANRLENEKLVAEKDRHQGEDAGPVVYNSYGRRDPFIPVQEGNSDNGIDIDQMRVVGIVWHPSDPMAVLQHVKEASVSFTIKQGDPVHNGRVSRITRDAVTFDITEYGISRAYSLKLVSMQERAKK